MGVSLAVSLEAIQDVLSDLAVGLTVCRDRENLLQLAGLLRGAGKLEWAEAFLGGSFVPAKRDKRSRKIKLTISPYERRERKRLKRGCPMKAGSGYSERWNLADLALETRLSSQRPWVRATSRSPRSESLCWGAHPRCKVGRSEERQPSLALGFTALRVANILLF